MEQERFDKLLDEVIQPNNMIPYIIQKMVEKPELLTGFKKINTFALRMYASFGQANNIKFGTILENYFQSYLKDLGWELLTRDYTLTKDEINEYKNDSDKVNIDIVAKYNNTIIFIEQKILDNHDSTKKIGQLRNFQEKASVLHREHPNNDIYGFEWFIDDSQHKNGPGWEKHNKKYVKTHSYYKDRLYVVYGNQLEQKLNEITKINHDGMLKSFETCIKNWHLSHKKLLPENNFDKYPMDVLDELKKYTFNKTYKMFSNSDLEEQIHPILFPNKQVYKAYYAYLLSYDKKLNKREKTSYDLLKNLLEEKISS